MVYEISRDGGKSLLLSRIETAKYVNAQQLMSDGVWPWGECVSLGPPENRVNTGELNINATISCCSVSSGDQRASVF
jgi:hypothetical protein